MAETRQRLAVFTKSPVPGTVKTRLIPDLGVNGATAVHRVLLEHVLNVCSMTKQVDLELWITGPQHHSGFADHPEFARYQQSGNNLGERMCFAVQNGLQDAQKMLITGGDCAQMSAACINQAFAALDRADLVIAPALDGGYVLIGQTRLYPELYTDIPWGSERVLEQTLLVAKSLGLVVSTLEPQTDVDQIEDLLSLETQAPQLWSKLEKLIPESLAVARQSVSCGSLKVNVAWPPCTASTPRPQRPDDPRSG